MVLLDLGCGTKKKEGYEGVDYCAGDGVDHVMNLDDPNLILPWEDDSVDAIYASHFFEHIVNIFPLMNECHRILKKNGRLDVVVPLAPSRSAFDDPTHVRFFTEATFKYFTNEPPGNQMLHQIKGRWGIYNIDWTPKYSEDIGQVFENKMRELKVTMWPIKEDK